MRFAGCSSTTGSPALDGYSSTRRPSSKTSWTLCRVTKAGSERRHSLVTTAWGHQKREQDIPPSGLRISRRQAECQNTKRNAGPIQYTETCAGASTADVAIISSTPAKKKSVREQSRAIVPTRRCWDPALVSVKPDGYRRPREGIYQDCNEFEQFAAKIECMPELHPVSSLTRHVGPAARRCLVRRRVLLHHLEDSTSPLTGTGCVRFSGK